MRATLPQHPAPRNNCSQRGYCVRSRRSVLCRSLFLPLLLLSFLFMAARANSSRAAHPASPDASVISSRDNRWLKEFRIALRGGLPTESGAVGVEGPRLVEEALRSASPIRAVLFSESGARHHVRLAPYLDRPEVAIPLLHTTDRLFEGL